MAVVQGAADLSNPSIFGLKVTYSALTGAGPVVDLITGHQKFAVAVLTDEGQVATTVTLHVSRTRTLTDPYEAGQVQGKVGLTVVEYFITVAPVFSLRLTVTGGTAAVILKGAV